MVILHTSAIFIALLLCTSSGSVDAKKKGKKSSKNNARNGKSSRNKARSSNSRKSYVAAPTYSPVLNAGVATDTATPTFAPIMSAAAKEPTFNIPVSSTWYSFETPEGAMPVMNAATEAPADEKPVYETSATVTPTLNAATASPGPTQFPTFAPTFYPSVSSPSQYEFSTPADSSPVSDAQTIASMTSTPSTATTTTSSKATTSTPSVSTTTISTDLPSTPSVSMTTMSPNLSSASPVNGLETSTTSPSGSDSTTTNTNNIIGTNETELCSSTSGVFFYTGENNGTEPFKLDVFTFAYELETFPRVSAEDVLPSLEVAFIDSLLSMLFPSQCGGESSRRLLASNNVVGISAEPADDATGAECEPELREKNRCEFIQGKISIFTTDGNTDAIMEEIEEALSKSMDDGVFNDPTSGIARVGYSVDEIPDEGAEGGDRIEDNGENNTVNPAANESGSMLGIGLSLSFAGVLLFVVGATAYRRTKRVGDHDASTLQDGVTVSGLNRFDGTEDSYMEGNGEIKTIPASPAARSLVENYRYSAHSNSDTAQE